MVASRIIPFAAPGPSRAFLALAWLIFWRVAAGLVLGGVVIGFITDELLRLMLKIALHQKLLPDGAWLSLFTKGWSVLWLIVFDLAWIYTVIWMAFEKRYRGFRLALVEPPEGAAAAQSTGLAPGRAGET